MVRQRPDRRGGRTGPHHAGIGPPSLSQYPAADLPAGPGDDMDTVITPSLPVGASEYRFPDPRPGAARDITVFAYRPSSFTPESPVLIVIHGRNRDGKRYRDAWIAQA